MITTTARRIAKTLNTYANMSVDWKVVFDADGHELDSHESGMWYANPADVIHGEYTFTGGNGQRFTARDIQNDLDAEAERDELLAGVTLEDLYGAEL